MVTAVLSRGFKRPARTLKRCFATAQARVAGATLTGDSVVVDFAQAGSARLSVTTFSTGQRD